MMRGANAGRRSQRLVSWRGPFERASSRRSTVGWQVAWTAPRRFRAGLFAPSTTVRSVAPSARRTTRKHASGSLGPRDPSRAPTTKDFAEERRPVEVGQSPRLSTPDCPEQGGDKIDVLPFYKGNQISDDGARLIRVVRRVGDDRGAIRAKPTRTHIADVPGQRHRAVGSQRNRQRRPHTFPGRGRSTSPRLQRSLGRCGARRRRRTDRAQLGQRGVAAQLNSVRSCVSSSNAARKVRTASSSRIVPLSRSPRDESAAPIKLSVIAHSSGASNRGYSARAFPQVSMELRSAALSPRSSPCRNRMTAWLRK
jgi:hypothetical protein